MKQLGPELFSKVKFASKQHCFDPRAAFSTISVSNGEFYRLASSQPGMK